MPDYYDDRFGPNYVFGMGGERAVKTNTENFTKP